MAKNYFICVLINPRNEMHCFVKYILILRFVTLY